MNSEIEKRTNQLMNDDGKEYSPPAAILFAIGATAIYMMVLSNIFGGFGYLSLFLSLILGGKTFTLYLGAHRKPYRQTSAKVLLVDEILKHRPALRRNLGKALKKNDYGTIVSDTRLKVVADFCDSIQFPKGILLEPEILAIMEQSLGDAAMSEALKGGDLDMVPADPILFERWVSDKLAIKGWQASVTPPSGDQGIDVIARKNGVSVGIQCKLYSGAVSNTAVQEVIAGVMYHGLDKGAVLTNARFTQSAINLARSANVVLLSNYDLSDPDKKLL